MTSFPWHSIICQISKSSISFHQLCYVCFLLVCFPNSFFHAITIMMMMETKNQIQPFNKENNKKM